ncbi:hypothetical protein KP509_10G048500 [Ceratopteris richardii]|uniref:Uncharacterized protein n=1 Tax=Ceratopteris richardii TaxID=49495 RepID=A0A8T2U0U4_CERRI|nr:hypothetical protein KP509_10G048500 [Ceratopteris richardii]
MLTRLKGMGLRDLNQSLRKGRGSLLIFARIDITWVSSCCTCRAFPSVFDVGLAVEFICVLPRSIFITVA